MLPYRISLTTMSHNSKHRTRRGPGSTLCRTAGIAALFLPLFGNAQSFTISTVAGSGPGVDMGDGGPAAQAQFCGPAAVAGDSAGNVYIADPCSSRVRKISAAGIVTTVAGGNGQGYAGDGGPASSAQLNDPEGLAVDSAGNLYIADDGAAVVRKVSTGGIITTVAGNGQQPFKPVDGVAATSIGLSGAHGVAVDAAGNVYIAEEGFARVRKVSADGTIATFAGGVPWNMTQGPMGDGGPASQASFGNLTALTTDAAGNLYIADASAGKVRKVDANGIISTVAGNGSFPGFAGDGGPASGAVFNGVHGIAVDANGNIFIADSNNNRIRMVSTTGVITTVAGDGDDSFTGDGSATTVGVANPNGVWASGSKVYVASEDDGRVRLLTPGTASGGTPATPVISEVDNAFSNIGNSPIESGSWVVIKGTNLTGTNPGRGWNANESFPTTMDGTSVTIDGKPAYLYYISPSQLNVQAPSDTAIGPVSVVVTNNGVSSAAATAHYQSDSPALLQWGGGQYPYALITRGGDYIGNPIIVPNTVPAHAGDTLTLWATGLGPTSPSIPAGEQPTTFPSVTPMPTITVGGVNVTVTAAVLRYAGLYQLNVQLPPSVPTGEQFIKVVEGSYQSPDGVLISIQ